MNVAFYATKIQAQVMKEREQTEYAYERYADATLFWCFVDLVESSNFRIVHGPKEGYVRGETFFSLVNAVIAPCPDIRVVKEIGDATFLAAPSFRPLLESVVLIDQAARQLAAVAATTEFPFDIRAAIGFGPAKRLTRPHEDFLGTPIDQLARIMTVRSETAKLFLHEHAYAPSVEILREYQTFLQVGEPDMVTAASSKHMLRPVFYRELKVNREALVEFRDHFVPWRAPKGSTTS